MLPRNLLAIYSQSFKAAFNGNFKKGIEVVTRLMVENPCHFELTFKYMQSGGSASMEIPWDD